MIYYMYDTTTAMALAKRIGQIMAVQQQQEQYQITNITIIIGDSPGRIGRPIFIQELQRLLYNNDNNTNNCTGSNNTNEI
jgi:hypothetical protein